MKNSFLSLLAIAALAFMTSCEGPMGPVGPTGANGTNGADGLNGVDANETCKLCHNPNSVDLIASQYELSKHGYGEAAFAEAGNTGCGPCHLSEAFKYVCQNNVSAAFIPDPANAGKYLNGYASVSTAAYGDITCNTCHSAIHSTYGSSDLPSLTTVAPVSMTFFGGTKTIDLQQDGGISNLCVKCHQPRPFTNSNTDKNVLDYANLIANPTALFYSAADPGVDVLKPSYRTHTHYGSVGAVFAGKGLCGVEFAGTKTYANSGHTTLASCQQCHMVEPDAVNSKSGGHTFFAKGNFNGCNVTGCHTGVDANNTTLWVNPRAAIKTLLDQLGAKLKVLNSIDGVSYVEILNRNPNTSETAQVVVNGVTANVGVNLWASLTTNKYDGYLNIYDPNSNPAGPTYNTVQFKSPSTTNWTAAQIAINNTLPVLTLTNAQMGAIINFQLCLREYSLGIHNYKYVEALLTNSIAAIP